MDQNSYHNNMPTSNSRNVHCANSSTSSSGKHYAQVKLKAASASGQSQRLRSGPRTKPKSPRRMFSQEPARLSGRYLHEESANSKTCRRTPTISPISKYAQASYMSPINMNLIKFNLPPRNLRIKAIVLKECNKFLMTFQKILMTL